MAELSAFKELYPFEPHFFELGDSGLRLHYLDEGPRTPGRAVVMLHGNPTWSFYYRNLVLALRDKYRCVAPDHIGCGLSDKPQDYAYTLAHHIANIDHLFARLELREVTLVMHDWGGAIGMGAAAIRPQRIKKLVVLNTAAFPSKHMPWQLALCRLPLFGAVAIRGLNAFARGALSMAVAHKERLTPQVRAGFLAPYDSWASRVANLRFVQDIPAGPRHQSWALLKEIEASLRQFQDRPMLLCWGMKDWCFNASFLKGWQERFPAAEVMRLEDAAHYVLEDAHERIAPKVREFLDK
ncbi:MAG: alpha/beta fold hydrolase [Planctomycetota bacterium]|nr:alpha/beta fold hydrolase [Planctomycetota bacterium]